MRAERQQALEDGGRPHEGDRPSLFAPTHLVTLQAPV